MNFHSTLLTACALLALNLQLFSQSHDKDGYYIDLKGDTVSGKFLNYREPSVSPTVLSFQANGAAGQISLTPEQCKKVSIDQTDHYISYQGKRQTNPVNFQNDQADTGDTFEDISAFLLELYNNGHYHLFQFSDSRRPNFYVSENEGPLKELSYKEFLNNGRVVEWPGFRLQLEDLFRPFLQNDPAKQKLIDQVSYNSSGLTDLFVKMAGVKNMSIAPKGKYPGQIFIGAGGSANSFQVSGTPDDQVQNNSGQLGTYPSQTVPLFEIGFRFFSQRNEGRIFYTVRFNYYHFEHSKSFNADFSNDQWTSTFKSNVLSFPVSVGYKFLKTQDFNLSLSAGFSLNVFTGNMEIDKDTYPLPSTNIAKYPVSNASFFGELSLEVIDRISFYGAYYSPVTVTRSDAPNPVHTSIRFGARVRVF